MWEVMSFGERPYWDMSNQDVSVPRSYQDSLVFYQDSLSCILDTGVGDRVPRLLPIRVCGTEG